MIEKQLTVDSELDVIRGDGPDPVVGRADVGAAVLLAHVGQVEDGALGGVARVQRVLAVLKRSNTFKYISGDQLKPAHQLWIFHALKIGKILLLSNIYY